MYVLSGTCHNSGSRSPFDVLTSALDRTFRDLSNGHSFRVCSLLNNAVLEQERLQKQSEKVAGVRGRQPPGKSRGVWGAAGPPMLVPKIIIIIKIKEKILHRIGVPIISLQIFSVAGISVLKISLHSFCRQYFRCYGYHRGVF